MPDAPFPPVAPPPPPPVPPIPVPSAPSVEDSADDLAALSPFAVLRKNTPSPIPTATPFAPPVPAPVVPPPPAPPLAPVPPVALPQPDHEALVRAAQTPAAPFILPDAAALTVPVPTPPALPHPVAPVLPATPKPVLPAAPLAPKAPIAATNRHVGLLAASGVLVGLLIIIGTAYGLAVSGVRVPFLYKSVSGLDPTGVSVASQAVALSLSYSQTGNQSVTVQGTGGTPALPPAGSQASGSVPTSYQVKLSSSTSQLKGGNFLGEQTLSIDSKAEIPFDLNTAGSQWVVRLPSNTNPLTTTINSSQLSQTLLYPLLQPISLADLLRAVSKETSYQRITKAGQKEAQYGYTFTGSKLSAYLPAGASWQTIIGTISYAWKTAQPITSSVGGTFSYHNTTYAYQASAQYAYGTAPAQSADLQAVANASADSLPTLSVADFAAQLGTSMLLVPNDLAPADQLPSGSGSTSVVVQPSGGGVTSVQPALIGTPALPVVPASAQAIQRDTQRLKDLADLQTALENYKHNQGSYPTSVGLEQTRASQTLLSALVPSFISKLPVDPLSDTFWYEYQSDGKTYTLRSVAEDPTNLSTQKGTSFSYFQLKNK